MLNGVNTMSGFKITRLVLIEMMMMYAYVHVYLIYNNSLYIEKWVIEYQFNIIMTLYMVNPSKIVVMKIINCPLTGHDHGLLL